ncbi:MAG: hypothetical protein LUQ54_05005, partial [Methanoregula sp.]|nr:hypothetical protein [Methanoregula sp.]
KSRFPWKTNPAKGAQKKANITHRAIMRAAITPFMDLPRTRTVISLTVNLQVGIKKVLPLIGDSFNKCIRNKRVSKPGVQDYYIIQEHFIGIEWKIFLGARK